LVNRARMKVVNIALTKFFVVAAPEKSIRPRETALHLSSPRRRGPIRRVADDAESVNGLCWKAVGET
jgi:hypothetical protein